MRIMIDTNVLISIIFFPSVQMNELKTKLCKRHTNPQHTNAADLTGKRQTPLDLLI